MNNKTLSMLTVLFLVIVMFMPLADPLTKLMQFSVYAKEYSSTAQLQNECSSEDGITTVRIIMQKQLEMSESLDISLLAAIIIEIN